MWAINSVVSSNNPSLINLQIVVLWYIGLPSDYFHMSFRLTNTWHAYATTSWQVNPTRKPKMWHEGYFPQTALCSAQTEVGWESPDKTCNTPPGQNPVAASLRNHDRYETIQHLVTAVPKVKATSWTRQQRRDLESVVNHWRNAF